MSLGGREVEATAVTADTGLNVLESVLDKLGDPLGVYKELTCNTDSINSTLCDSSSTNLGIHSTRTNHGNIYKFLNMSYS